MCINIVFRILNYREVYILRYKLYNNRLFFRLFIITIIKNFKFIIDYTRE